MFVISYIYPTTRDPKGHGSSSGFYRYPMPYSRQTILRKTVRPPAVKVGLPFLPPPRSAWQPCVMREEAWGMEIWAVEFCKRRDIYIALRFLVETLIYMGTATAYKN